jgi:TonB family protein
VGEDDAKRLILARRARFVAAAVAGISVASCDPKSATSGDAGAAQASAPIVPIAPGACLKPPALMPPEDGGLGEPPDSPRDAAPPPEGNVETTVTVAGTLPRAEAVVRGGFVPHARSCYRAALRSDPTLAARVVVSVKVQADGDVESAAIASDGGASTLGACVASAARRLHFDETPKGAVVTITTTFSLRK